MNKHKAERSIDKNTVPYSVLLEDGGVWIRDNNFVMFLATMCRRAHNAIKTGKTSFRADGEEYKVETFVIRKRECKGIRIPITHTFPYKVMVRKMISEGIPDGKKAVYEDIIISNTKKFPISIYIIPHDPVPNPDGTPRLARGDFRISLDFMRPIFIKMIDKGYGREPVKTVGTPMDCFGKCGFSDKGPYALLFNQNMRSEQLLLIDLMSKNLVTGTELIHNGSISEEAIKVFVEDGVITEAQAYGPSREQRALVGAVLNKTKYLKKDWFPGDPPDRLEDWVEWGLIKRETVTQMIIEGLVVPVDAGPTFGIQVDSETTTSQVTIK